MKNSLILIGLFISGCANVGQVSSTVNIAANRSSISSISSMNQDNNESLNSVKKRDPIECLNSTCRDIEEGIILGPLK